MRCEFERETLLTSDMLYVQYNKILDALSKKPFATKCDHKNYSNMLVLSNTFPWAD